MVAEMDRFASHRHRCVSHVLRQKISPATDAPDQNEKTGKKPRRSDRALVRVISAIKRLIRSRDVAFAFALGKTGARQSLRWKGQLITYRSKTSDLAQIERLLLLGKRCEYNLPRRIRPSHILDAGANIGLATLFFSEYFPEAKIVCCEPSPDNLELLRLNTSHLPNVTVLVCALGKEPGSGSVVQKSARNYARAKVVESSTGNVPIYDYSQLARVSGVPFFDLIKIDIEGAEYGFLSSMTEEQLARCSWIVGEVHGVDEWLLLDLLSRHFSIDIRKTMGNKPSKFHACSLNKTDAFLRDFDISILQK
jgi:FkbM family methyltransferase